MTKMMTIIFRVTLTGWAGLSLVACSSTATTADPDRPPTSTAVRPTGAPSESDLQPDSWTVTDTTGEEITITSTERIIPIDGDVAEVVFALGLGDQVVATDLSATYPPAADALPQIGYQRSLTAEPIIEFEPTLVIGTPTAGPPETLQALRDVGIPVVIVDNPATIDGPAIKIRAIGEALGIPERGDALADQAEAEIEAARNGRAEPVNASDRPRIVALYLRGADVTNLLGSGMAIDWLIEAAGGINVGAELGVTKSEPITAEALLAAAPEVIVVTTSGLASVGGIEALLALPGIATTPAAQARNVLAYDDQLLLGNGPRVGKFLATLISDLAAIDLSPRTSGSTGDDP